MRMTAPFVHLRASRQAAVSASSQPAVPFLAWRLREDFGSGWSEWETHPLQSLAVHAGEDAREHLS